MSLIDKILYTFANVCNVEVRGDSISNYAIKVIYLRARSDFD